MVSETLLSLMYFSLWKPILNFFNGFSVSAPSQRGNLSVASLFRKAQ
jgi:hypothetical protein